MPGRVRPVVLAVCVLLAGCASGGAPGTTGTTPTATTADGGEGCGDEPSPPPRDLPDPPDDPDRRSAAAAAVAYEEAIKHNDLLDGSTTDVDVSVEVEGVDRTPTGYVVYLSGGWSHERCDDGNVGNGMGTIGANYFVNGTVVVRLDRPPNRTTDPRDRGTVVDRESPG